MRRIWKRANALALTLLMILSMFDGFASPVYAESVNPTETVRIEPETSIEPAPTEMPNAQETEIPAEETQTEVPSEETTVQPTENSTPSPESSLQPELTEEVPTEPSPELTEIPATEEPADTRTLIEKTIDESGYAYVQTDESDIPVYSTDHLSETDLVGTISNGDSVLFAESYTRLGENSAAVSVRFLSADDENTEIQGYVRMRDLKDAVITPEDALQICRYENPVWMDSEHTLILPQAEFVDAQTDEAAVENDMAIPAVVNEDETKYLTIQINWVGDADKTSLRPNSVSANVKKTGETSAKTYSIARDGNWVLVTDVVLASSDSYEFDYLNTDLQPVYKITGSTYADGVLTITIECMETFDPTIVFSWDDNQNQNGLRPETLNASDITLTHKNDSTINIQASSVVQNENGSFTAYFQDVPTYHTNADGTVAANRLYEFKGTVDHLPAGYTMGSYGTRSDKGEMQAQSHLQAIIQLQARKVTAKFYMYSYLYNSSGSSSIYGWQYAAERGVDVPESIRMTLTNNGEPLDIPGTTVTFERNSNGTYPTMEHTWYLPVYDSTGHEIEYGELAIDYSPSVEKGTLSKAYSQNVNSSSSSTGTQYFTITTRLKGIGSVSVYDVTWDDAENQTGVRPTSLNVSLLKNGELSGASGVQAVKADGTLDTVPTFLKYLPQKDENGNPIHYGIQIDNLPAYYTVEFTEDPVFTEENGYGSDQNYISRVNEKAKFPLKSQSAKATVLWGGDGIGTDAELKNRPASVDLRLEYSSDNGATWQVFWGTSIYSVTPGTSQNEWNYEWSKLPAVDADGNPVLYRVSPINASSAYVTSVEEPKYTQEDGKTTHSDFVIHNSYNDNWNYTVDLKWNETTATRKYAVEEVTTARTNLVEQYLLSISVQKNYDAGALEVRLPYELFDSNDKNSETGTVINRVSLGDEKNPSSNYSFTYRIDDKGTKDTSDDEIVFYNYKPLTASDNCTIMVEYNILPYQVRDCSVGSLTATATGQYQGQTEKEVQQSSSITYRLDTGVKMTRNTKTLNKMMYYWDTSLLGTEIEDFDMTKYNYVLYEIEATCSTNQDSILTLYDQPGSDGEVILVCRQGSSKSRYEISYDETTHTYSWKFGVGNTSSSYPEFYVVVRYPRIEHENPLNPGQTTYEADYENVAEFELKGIDEHPGDKTEDDLNDIVSATQSASVHWVDYAFHYDGEIYSSRKQFWTDFITGALTTLQYGGDARACCCIQMTVNGYEFENGYSMELTDDALYLCATIDGKTTEYVRLDEGDYELANWSKTGRAYISLDVSDIDRTNGKRIEGKIPNGEFVIWGRKGNNGAWEEITRLKMTRNGQSLSLPDIDGQGYTALRVTTPDDLSGKFIVNFWFGIIMKGSSERVSQWANQAGVTQMTVQNLAAFNLYSTDENGQRQWINPQSASSNSFAAKNGLDNEDLAANGAYLFRKNDNSSLYPARETAQLTKYVDRPLNYDVTNELVTARFTIMETETISIKDLPEEVYREKCQNAAVIYDLLPEGFVYASDEKTEVFGTNISLNSTSTSQGGVTYYPYTNAGKGSLVSVQTIDDYKGTGRQMVIFTVRSTLADGKNYYAPYSNWNTGFVVQFSARASYDDVTSGVELYNIAAAQRADGGVIKGGYTERGYGGSSSTSIFVLDEAGQRALYDLNGDGVVSEETNTLYGYTSFTPSLIQTIENGQSKLVKGKSGIYRKDDVAVLGRTYSYKLRLRAQKNGETSNVVLYDILENAANTGGAVGESEGWKGTFVSANMRAVKAMGVDAVLYYSTEALSYNDPQTLLIENNPDAWSTTPPEDLSKVTAVAFDLRKAADGSDFVFPEDSVAEVEITLRAPEKMQSSVYAYNRPAYNSTFKSTAAVEGTTSFNISGRTTLRLADLQTFRFVKECEREDGTRAPLANTEFKLYMCTNTEEGHTHRGTPGGSSTCFSKLVSTATSMTDGSVVFTDLDTGVYAIKESSAPTGYQTFGSQYWIIEVDATKGTVSDPINNSTLSTKTDMVLRDGTWTLLNVAKKTQIGIRKEWVEERAHVLRPSTLTFDLYRNGELYKTATINCNMTYTSMSYSKVFADLPAYDEYGTLYIYKVVEHIPEGYTEANGGVWSSNWNYSSNWTASFTNTRLGVLDVKKVVSNSDTKQKFGISVTISDADGKPLTGNVTARRFTNDAKNYTSETLTPDANGKLSFELAGGETLRLIGLPIGATWTAVEGENAYTSSVTPNPASGTVKSDTIAKAVFTNTAQSTSLSIPVSKSIQYVKPPKDKTFTFTLTAKEGAPVSSSAVNGVDTLTITGEGSGSFGTITYTKTGVWHYTAQEIAGSDTGYTYDKTIFDVTVTVTDENGLLNAVWTVDGEHPETLAFTNDYKPESTTLSLPVRKAFSADSHVRPNDKTFTFEIAAVTENAPMPENLTVSIVGEGETKFGAIAYTEVGQWQYRISEKKGTDVGYTYSDTVYTATVTVVDDDGKLKASWSTDNGTEMVFENEYHPSSVEFELPVKKVIEGDATPTDKTFTFQLTANDDAPLPNNTLLSIQGSGMDKFGAIAYTEAGTYRYTLTEQAGSDAGYTYDSHSYAIEVTISDQDGVLQANWTVDDQAADCVTVTNTYHPQPVSLDLPVTKQIVGEARPNEKQFTFALSAAEGTPMPETSGETVTITGEGSANFGSITFESAGTYTYTVQEIAGKDPGYGYDTATHTVVVTVTDKDGTLEAEWNVDGEKADTIAFTNRYQPSAAMLSLPILKQLTGDDTPQDVQFSFTLTALDGAPMPSDAENGASNLNIVGAGRSSFGVIAYSQAGTYRYQVRETAGDATGYEYDSSVYDVTVTVRDEDGQLAAEWSTQDGKQELVFTNHYQPESVALTLPVRKIVNGNVPEDGDKKFTFTLSATSTSAPMPEADSITIIGNGTANFETLVFEHAGVYEYSISETDGGEPGYTYDASVHSIVVNVRDEGGILKANWTADGETVQEICFTNDYVPTPVQIVLGANKVLQGKKLQENLFTFELKDESGNLIEAVGNTADGSVSFAPIEYTEVGEYVYTISEKAGNMKNVVYDTKVYTVRVTVTDENGALVAKADMPTAGIVFTNTYQTDIPKTGDDLGRIPSRVLFLLALAMIALGTCGNRKLNRKHRQSKPMQ